MNRITVQGSLKNEFDALVVPAEVIDETGRRLGHFVPSRTMEAAGECPYSEEELGRMRAEQGGRPLSEIWKSLHARPR